MLTADILKASHASIKTEFMWWGENFVVLCFSIHSLFSTLYRDFSFSFGILSLDWSLIESPAFSKKGWMFLPFIFLIVRSSKWLSYPSKKSIWLLKGEAPHTLENWVVDLIHPSLSIYPDGVWWNFQYSGVLKWISWEYSLAWCTMMGDMKYCPLYRVKTSNVHQNVARSPVHLPHWFTLK